jgi:hypothetical protein
LPKQISFLPKFFFILGGWANPVVEPETLDFWHLPLNLSKKKIFDNKTRAPNKFDIGDKKTM